METITIPKKQFEEMREELEKLREKNNLIKTSADDLSLVAEESFAETWLNEKEDKAWKDL